MPRSFGVRQHVPLRRVRVKGRAPRLGIAAENHDAGSGSVLEKAVPDLVAGLEAQPFGGTAGEFEDGEDIALR